MPFPRPRPFTLRQKLTLLLVGTATVALLVFATAALVIEVIRARAALVRDAASLADLLAVTVAPSLTFNDPGAATESLGALRTRPNVVAAWLIPEGATKPIAAFARPEAFAEPPPARTYSGHEFLGPWLFYHEPVAGKNGTRLGTLVLQANLGSWWDRIGDYAGALALMLALMLGLALWLASRRQRVVADPVLDLAATARRVSERGDYSVRATRRSDDEIGTLVDGFNEMLGRVESGNAALRASEERLSYALRGTTDGLWDWDLGTNDVNYSPRWKEMLGYSEDELGSELATWEKLVHPDDRAPTLRLVKDFLEGRSAKYEAEFRMMHKDGNWLHILARGAAIRDADGRALRLVGTHVDITSRKQIEAEIRQLNETLDQRVQERTRDWQTANAALRERDLQLRLALEASHAGTWSWDAATNTATWDEMYAELYGFGRNEPPSHEGWLSRLHPEDRERVSQAVKALSDPSTSSIWDQEFRVIHPTKGLRWMAGLGRIERGPDGRAVSFSGINLDITARKTAEAGLQASEKRFRAVFEQAAVGVAIIETATGQFVQVNQRYCDILGMTPAQMTATTFMAITHPDDLAEDLRQMDQLKSGTVQNFSMEKRLQRMDGQHVWVNLAVSRMWSPGEAPNFHIAVVEDVTRRKQAEEEIRQFNRTLEHRVQERTAELQLANVAVRQSEARLAEAQSIAHIGGYEVNPLTGETNWSEEMYRLRGRDRALGPPAMPEIIETVHPEDRNRVAAALRRVFATGGAFREEYRGVLPDGRLRHFLSTALASNDERGRIVRFAGTLQDITERKLAEAALRASETRFRQMADAIRQVFWLGDPTKAVVEYVSPAYETIWGRPCEELYANPKIWAEAIHPEDRARVWEAAQLKQAAGTYDEEYRILRPDGTVVWIRDRAFPIKNSGGNVVAVCGVADDITTRKRAEEQRDRFFNLSLDLLCVAELNGAFKRVNPAFTRALGWSQEELLSRPIIEFVHPEDRAATEKEFTRLGRAENVVDFENRYLCKDGSTRVLSWSCAAPAPGELTLFAVARDVTIQRMAQAAQAESEQKFRQLAESAPIGIFLTSSDGECRYVNPHWCELTGLTPEAAAGHGWVSALHPDDAERVGVEWTAAVKEGREFRTDYRFQRPDGTVCWVEGGAAALREMGGLVTGFVGSVVDVTERRELERELIEISDREQARLGQEVHDGLCQQLVSTGFSARALEQRLADLRHEEAASARAVAELIDGAITQSYALVGGLFPAQLAGESLASALHEFVHHASHRLTARFIIDYPEPIHLDAAQSTHLYRIAREAITNALKHAHPARVWVRLWEHNGLVRLTVENDGVASGPGPAQSGGYGLRMMRYRATLLGGTLESRLRDGGGMIVTCVFRALAPRSPGTEPETNRPA